MTNNQFTNLLTHFKSSKVLFIPNSGNAGDALIAEATFSFFEKNAVKYSIPDRDSDYEGKILVIGGGGHLVNYYNNVCSPIRDAIKRYHSVVEKLIILPHTINNFDGYLSILGSNTVIYCRDRKTYEYVNRYSRNYKSELMDDMAFTLDAEELTKLPNISSLFTLPLSNFNKQLFVAMCSFAKNYANEKKRKYNRKMILNCFREDTEKTYISIPPNNIDIPEYLKGSMTNRKKVHNISNLLAYFVNLFDCVHTNRLHICIISALLGKQVFFYPNSYYKNEAIYNYSIKDKFLNVTWKPSENYHRG